MDSGVSSWRRPSCKVAAWLLALALVGPAKADELNIALGEPGTAELLNWTEIQEKGSPDTDFECLRLLPRGCSEVKDRGVCLHSRDGRFNNDFGDGDLNISGSPCVWCGDGQCTSASDSMCEPLDYLRKGAPKYFPSFLQPGSFAIAGCDEKVKLPDLDYKCLLWSEDGCNWIDEENLCLRSRDGRKNDRYLGKGARGDPCVWCGGGVCTEHSDAKCLSFDFLFNGQGTIYNYWHTPEFSKFAACDAYGQPRPARIGPAPDYKVTFVLEDMQCGGQNWEGQKTCPEGTLCIERGINSFCVRSSSLPGRFITAGRQVWWQNFDGNTKHMVPPGVDCARCGCRGNMTIVKETTIGAIPTGDEFNCEMMSEEVPQTLNSTENRFITAGEQVYWHSNEDGKLHEVQPGVDCSRCGCEGQLYLVTPADLEAIPVGASFDCGLNSTTGITGAEADASTSHASAAKVQQFSGTARGVSTVFMFFFLAGAGAIAAWNCFQMDKKESTTRAVGLEQDSNSDLEDTFLKSDQAPVSVQEPTPPPMQPPPAVVSYAPVTTAYTYARGQAVRVMPRAAAAPTQAGQLSTFDMIDADHDGQITREEWQKYAFDAFDRNHDGQITAGEWRQARTRP